MNKVKKFHSECVGVRGMMNSNSEAVWCGVRDENSFYKLTESASIARHSIRGFKAIHFYVKASDIILNNNWSSYLNERKIFEQKKKLKQMWMTYQEFRKEEIGN